MQTGQLERGQSVGGEQLELAENIATLPEVGCLDTARSDHLWKKGRVEEIERATLTQSHVRPGRA